MPVQLNEIKQKLQDHLTEGLLIVVGTGLSNAEGIPGMYLLAQQLKNEIPNKINKDDHGWMKLVTNLDEGKDLETAMSDVTLSPEIIDAIISETANYILEHELKVIQKVISGKYELPLTPFVKHLFKAGKKFHLITPNYDRLIELATESAGIGVDSRFFGYLYGQINPKKSADSHRESFIKGRNKEFRNLQCLNIYKPHGSLDWYEIDGKIIRSPILFDRTPIIITPGISKYRESFKLAIDDQRVNGNKAVNDATKLLFIGNGFNDDHLEQYICPGRHLEKPTVIITKVLSSNAKQLISNSKNTDIIALTAFSDTDSRTRIISTLGDDIIVDEELWNLNGFNKGVI